MKRYASWPSQIFATEQHETVAGPTPANNWLDGLVSSIDEVRQTVLGYIDERETRSSNQQTDEQAAAPDTSRTAAAPVAELAPAAACSRRSSAPRRKK